MRILCGPLVWRDGSWNPHEAALSILDLRTLQEMGTPGLTDGEMAGSCLHFVADDDAKIGNEWEVLGSGALKDVKLDQRLIDLLPKRPRYRLAATNLKEYIWEALTVGATPDGSDFARPLMPTMSRRLSVVLPGLNYSESFVWGGSYTSNIRDVLRADFAETLDRQQKGQTTDPKLAEMTLDFQMKKLGVVDWKELVPKTLQDAIQGPEPHKTSYADNFNRANGNLNAAPASGGYNYTNLVGGSSVVSNECKPGKSNSSTRGEADLSSSDNYCQVVVTAHNNTGSVVTLAGICCRFSGSADSTYAAALKDGGDALITYKRVTGTMTALATTLSVGLNTGVLLSCTANGSAITTSFDTTTNGPTTDTSLSSGLRFGIYGDNGNAEAYRFDNLLAGDLTPPANASRIFRRKPLRVWRR